MVHDDRNSMTFRRIALKDTGSTNDEARSRIADVAEHAFVVTAERQLQGRGRRGRDWISPPGNLYASFAFDPARPVGELPELSFVAALAVCDMARDYVPDPGAVRCKWPNDVLIDGAKLSGILLETAAMEAGRLAVIVGIGVNIASKPADTPYPAVALGDLVDGIAVETVLAGLSGHLRDWVAVWQSEGFQAIRKAWLARADGMGEPVVARLPDREVHGIFAGLAEDGALVLETGGGDVVRIAAADVFRPNPQE
ncbi:biotin--[acetyl-CoA-carboxylase] ligase [Minwuia sp.]|uniref:biotin--[acetyl-CoA-carboxylase] ligase n=1 Tax=Minwuia sp. TaxID=2493630 RepID=UPI003A8F6383